MSFSQPSQVSATTGSDHHDAVASAGPCLTRQAITASRTTPTLCVLVIIAGPSRKPDSSTQVVPVISPLPFSVNQPAKTGSLLSRPRGRTAVTPVRTGPTPTFSGPLPEIRVVLPTCTPATSVMALSGPGVPSKGTPKSRARGGFWAKAAAVPQKRMATALSKTTETYLAEGRCGRDARSTTGRIPARRSSMDDLLEKRSSLHAL